jgi:two-component system cell cycle sensor histidine kinase/response regulator CckA
MDAFRVLKQSGKCIPFILVTGTLGEETAVELIKGGVADHILKDRLARLPVAVRRALQEKAVIEKHEQAIQALRETEERVRLLLNSTVEAIFGEDLQGNCTFCNPACVRLLGYNDPVELLGKNMHALTHHTQSDGTPFPIEGCRIYRASHTCEGAHADDEIFWRKDGTSFPTEYWSYPILRNGRPIGVAATFFDITERKRGEERLRKSEESYRLLVERAPDAILVHRQGKTVFANGACAALFGASSASDLLRTQHLDFIHPDDREVVKQRIQEFSYDLESVRRNETKLLRFDGREAYAEVVARSVIYQGEPAVQLMFRDISQRKRAEQELREHQASLSTAQRIAHLGNLELDLTDLEEADKSTLRWSDEVFRIFGYEPGQIEISRSAFFRAVYPSDRDRIRGALADLLRDGKSLSLEFRITRPDGTERIVQSQMDVVYNEKTRKPLRLIGTIQDITERRQLENQYRQAQKMEAVGRLSGGIAHDFNNLLGVILGYSEVLADRLEQNSELHKHAKEIRKAGLRAASLTRQLLAFSRQQVLEPKVLNLNGIVADTQRMLGRLIGEDIELTTVLARELGSVKADLGQVEQVIMNLAVNARDAMPKGGKLILETANVELDDAFARQHPPTVPGRYVLLAVTDTGVGMDKEIQAQIFEPFFTTKGKDKGTGLGLSVVYGVVKQSGGYIWVHSEPEKGTTFKIYLPFVEEAVETVSRNIGPAKSSRGSETILVVEDEESLRVLIRDLLLQSGYTVLEASDGVQALEIAHQHPGIAHLLLTDVVLPGMSGRELAGKLVLARPDTRVLFMSGYTDYAVTAHGVLEEGTFLLQKPFTRHALTGKVREVLDCKAIVKPYPGIPWSVESE